MIYITVLTMIESFRSKALERYWWKGDPRRVDTRHHNKLRRQLAVLDSSASPEGMNVPGWRFHRLSGRESGRFAVWVDQNWRLTFGWGDQGPDAIDVDYEDYH